ncbi:FAD-dependent oxidoreductase [Micromonospora sp. NPDC023814]|uniref:FAD-dependent oxidoreductase n=1 Tax=Micromonospora sp. NPDC023814 TaxID=3154596 RepID=UPI0033C3FC08
MGHQTPSPSPTAPPTAPAACCWPPARSTNPGPSPGAAERFGPRRLPLPLLPRLGSPRQEHRRARPRTRPSHARAYLADRYANDIVVATHGPHELPEPILANLDALKIPVLEQPVTAVTGELDALQLHLADGTTLDRQAVFHRAPTRQHAPLAAQVGAELLPDGYVRVDEFAQTSIPGVSAAGDLARLPALPDGLTLVSQAAADGVRAAVWLEQGLFRAGLPVPLG